MKLTFVRGDVTRVSRLLSARMNANDDNGLLTGKWEGPWNGGILPWAWRGSGKVFKTYLGNSLNSIGWGKDETF